MMVSSLHIHVHGIVLSGVPSRLSPPCRRASSSVPHLAHHPAQPSNVQASRLERVWPVAIATFAGGLVAGSTAPPGRRRRERKRQAKAEGKTKGCGTQPPAESVCTWGWRGTMRLCRRAAWGARPAPRQGWPCALHDRLRHSFAQRLQGAQP